MLFCTAGRADGEDGNAAFGATPLLEAAALPVAVVVVVVVVVVVDFGGLLPSLAVVLPVEYHLVKTSASSKVVEPAEFDVPPVLFGRTKCFFLCIGCEATLPAAFLGA